ncbi:MAG: tripartite tricarboxylate transporter permease [Candidatus Micrarchaeota archaeon]|nr:tripartite tricarboxylate transporter permease [Candidatus Micrarchaeota archaeon]
MPLEIVLAFFTAFVTSLIPAFHPNNISFLFSNFNSRELSLAVLYSSQAFFTMIISTLFFIPDSSTTIMPLPAQRLVLKNKTMLAILLIAFTTILTSLICLLIHNLIIDFYKGYTNYFNQALLLFFVIIFTTYAILAENNKLIALIYFLLCGYLGILAFNHLSNPFITIFSALFGVTAIISSSNTNHNQISFSFTRKDTEKALALIFRNLNVILIAILLSTVAEVLPTISSDAQLAFLALPFLKNDYSCIILLSAISASHLFTTVISNYSVSLKRTGFSASIESITGYDNLVIIIFTIFLSLIASVITIFILLKKINEIKSYVMNNLRAFYLILIVISNYVINSYTGIVFLFLFSILGFIPYYNNIKRFLGMGSIALNYIITTSQRLL